MSDREALDAFLDKWRARWPEWRIAEVFVPVAQRELAVAWFALRQELLDASWGGSDPIPGQAKLAWWLEELHGWQQGRRRHPLGLILQRQAAPWNDVALASATLACVREQPARDADEARGQMQAFASVAADVDAALFAADKADIGPLVCGLLVDHLLLRPDAAVPLRTRAQVGTMDPIAMQQAWMQELWQRWPSGGDGGSPALRILAALQRERLHRARADALPRAIGAWPALWTAWRSARR